MLQAEETHTILSIDIGGTFIKAAILDFYGILQTEYKRVATPRPANPQKLVATIEKLVRDFSGFQKISVGFPGYVRDGIVITCPQLGTEKFTGFNLSQKLQQKFKLPVRLINDADLQGLGIASGKGFELVITLGTGLGSALLLNGHLLPHLELSQHPFTKKNIYDSYIGASTLEKIGVERWNRRVQKILTIFKTVFNYDHLYIGGGNAAKINFKPDENITIVSNIDGIKGGARLWQMSSKEFDDLEKNVKHRF